VNLLLCKARAAASVPADNDFSGEFLDNIPRLFHALNFHKR
jgi:hypothetical protein